MRQPMAQMSKIPKLLQKHLASAYRKACDCQSNYTSDLAIVFLFLRMSCMMISFLTSPLGMHGMMVHHGNPVSLTMLWVKTSTLLCSSNLSLPNGLRNVMICGNLGQVMVAWFNLVHAAFLFSILTKRSIKTNGPRWWMGFQNVEVVPASSQWRTLFGPLQLVQQWLGWSLLFF